MMNWKIVHKSQLFNVRKRVKRVKCEPASSHYIVFDVIVKKNQNRLETKCTDPVKQSEKIRSPLKTHCFGELHLKMPILLKLLQSF